MQQLADNIENAEFEINKKTKQRAETQQSKVDTPNIKRFHSNQRGSACWFFWPRCALTMLSEGTAFLGVVLS